MSFGGESRQYFLNFSWQELRRWEHMLLTETEVTRLDEKRINVLELEEGLGVKRERRVGSVTDTTFNIRETVNVTTLKFVT